MFKYAIRIANIRFFCKNHKKLNMKHKLALSILVLFISFSAHSGPARKGPIYLVQPDGTTFIARIRGDEFKKTVTTENGNSVIQEAEGWWCYAYYDESGRKTSSGHRVGADAPASVIAASTNIPPASLFSVPRLKRMQIKDGREPIMRRMFRQKGIDTKVMNSGPVTKHGLIILAQFRNEKFTHTREDFVNMLTQSGYNRNGATGSAKEYFDAQFGGRVEFSFDVSSIVTLPFDMAHYGANGKDDNDVAPEKMVIDACELADDEIDFSLYDDDNDGFVDNVFIFFAGGDEAEGAGDDRIWSHAWYIYSGAGRELSLDGKQIDRYACTAELSRRYINYTSHRDVLAGIGTFCHEYFHTFGIPDMYDTDYEGSGGTAAALWGSTSLMDSGNQNNNGNTPPYLNAAEREYLGISEPVVIGRDGGYTLEPIHLNGQCYRVDTDNEDEYYLFEYRSGDGWDRHLGGEGMLVYHIDKSDRKAGYSESYGEYITAAESWGDYNEVNSRPAHQCADLMEADGRKDSFSINETESHYASMNNIRSIFFPNATTNSLHPDSRPGLVFWSGEACEVSITNIRKENGTVSFNVLGLEGAEAPPAVATAKAEAFMDAAIILFESDREFEGEATVKWGKTDSEQETVTVKPYLPGKYSITLEGLEPNNRTYSVKICFTHDGLTGEERTLSFMTKKRPVVIWPFIYMNGVAKNEDGTLPAGCKLPLRVYNSNNADEITWEFNGSVIEAGGDGYFTVDRSGTLKARIIHEDGSEEILMKEIRIGKEAQK